MHLQIKFCILNFRSKTNYAVCLVFAGLTIHGKVFFNVLKVIFPSSKPRLACIGL